MVNRPLTDEAADRVGMPSPERAAIVAEVAELFLYAGYGDVSMDAITAKAGVSKHTV